MNRKRKRITLIVLLLAITALAIPIGLKYFPFTKVVKMPSAPEAEYGGSVTSRTLPPHALWYDFEVPAGKPVPDGFYNMPAGVIPESWLQNEHRLPNHREVRVR